jgi:branched-chain amino acid transport system permease protein
METAASVKAMTARPSTLIKNHWHILLLIAVVALFPLLSPSYFITLLGIILVINGIIIIGMTLLIRYIGVFSMGQSAFFLTGAYISGSLTAHGHLNPWLAMGIAALASVFAAYLFCAPFLKLRAIYLGIATLGLAQVMYIVAKNLDQITGGVAGLTGIPYLNIGSLTLGEDWQQFYLSGLFLIFFAFIGNNVGRTRLGRAYLAIHSNETAAQAAGINVEQNMRDIFCFAALLASLAGSLLAHFITFLSPDSFAPESSLTYLIIVIIGGANIWAGLLTMVVLMGFSESARGLQDLSTGLFALLLIVAFFLFPDGLSAVLFKKGKAAKKMAVKYLSDVKGNIMDTPSMAQGSEKKGGRILDISNLSMRYGGTEALSQVSFSVDYGQIVGIIGPNGAGKTTLLNAMNGYLIPPQGKIIYRDTDVTKKPPHEMARMGVGRTFQLINLFKGMTVIENVMVGCHLKGKSGIFESGLRFKRARYEERTIFNTAVKALHLLDLMDRAYEIVDNLSFGEQRAVELARALAMEPDLLFLDEPAAGLNTVEAVRLGSTLCRIRDMGITIILVEHNTSLVMSVSDRVCVLNFGKVIAWGTPEHVCRHEEVIQAYLGPREEKNAS